MVDVDGEVDVEAFVVETVVVEVLAGLGLDDTHPTFCCSQHHACISSDQGSDALPRPPEWQS